MQDENVVDMMKLKLGLVMAMGGPGAVLEVLSRNLDGFTIGEIARFANELDDKHGRLGERVSNILLELIILSMLSEDVDKWHRAQKNDTPVEMPPELEEQLARILGEENEF